MKTKTVRLIDLPGFNPSCIGTILGRRSLQEVSSHLDTWNGDVVCLDISAIRQCDVTFALECFVALQRMWPDLRFYLQTDALAWRDETHTGNQSVVYRRLWDGDDSQQETT